MEVAMLQDYKGKEPDYRSQKFGGNYKRRKPLLARLLLKVIRFCTYHFIRKTIILMLVIAAINYINNQHF